jgi:hypothetical protein
MQRPKLRLALVAVVLALPALGGCFLPGGTAPDGCDLEPNGDLVLARPIGFGQETLSCNFAGGGDDTDVFRLPHMGDAAFPLRISCGLVAEGGNGATAQLDFVFDDGERTTLVDAYTCSGTEDFLQALLSGTPYLIVYHPDSQSERVSVQVEALN